MKKRIPLLLVVIGVAAFLIPSLWGENPATPGQRDYPSCEAFGVQRFEVRKEAPPFSLKNLDEKLTSLSDFRGKPVLMIFWAAWCPSCREEIPVIEKHFSGRQDQVAILLLAIDGDKEKRVRRYVQKEKITLPVLLDAREKVARTFGVTFHSCGLSHRSGGGGDWKNRWGEGLVFPESLVGDPRNLRSSLTNLTSIV